MHRAELWVSTGNKHAQGRTVGSLLTTSMHRVELLVSTDKHAQGRTVGSLLTTSMHGAELWVSTDNKHAQGRTVGLY